MITIDDISAETGLGRSTAAAVLSGKAKKHRISDKTAKIVLDAAERLGYYRNIPASQMLSGKTAVIGFMSPDLGATEYSGAMLSGIMEEAAKSGFSCAVFPYDKADIPGTIRGIIERRPSGIICRTVQTREFETISAKLAEFGIPLLSLNINDAENGLFVVTDDDNGIFAAVEHLYNLGHRRLCMPVNKISADPRVPRTAGFLKAINHFSLSESRPIPVETATDVKTEDIIPILKEGRFTAIVCDTDYIAMRVIQCAHSAGLKVPDDISVTGFADIAAAKLCSPPLTTVRQPFREHGVAAAKILLEKIGCEAPAEMSPEKTVRIVKTRLVIRDSCGPPKQ
jgi:LacI family transcriptional regulator